MAEACAFFRDPRSRWGKCLPFNETDGSPQPPNTVTGWVGLWRTMRAATGPPPCQAEGDVILLLGETERIGGVRSALRAPTVGCRCSPCRGVWGGAAPCMSAVCLAGWKQGWWLGPRLRRGRLAVALAESGAGMGEAGTVLRVGMLR